MSFLYEDLKISEDPYIERAHRIPQKRKNNKNNDKSKTIKARLLEFTDFFQRNYRNKIKLMRQDGS